MAADPDREGEAICYHLQEELNGSKKGPKFYRVMFNEITANAIKKAFEKPGSVNLHLVDAQQARRVLDRLVGYKISPLLWDKVRRGLSAGRVQTVALRLIVDREREIRAFIKREYWTIDVQLNAKKPPVLTARFTKKNDEAIELPDEAHHQEPAGTVGRLQISGPFSLGQGEEAQPGPAVYYIHVATGVVAQAALQREADHDAGAAAV